MEEESEFDFLPYAEIFLLSKTSSSALASILPQLNGYWKFFTGRDCSVGIATRYELDGPWIESRWGRFSSLVQTGRGAHPASYTVGTGSF